MLALVPLLPLLAAVLLLLIGPRLPRPAVTAIGLLGPVLSALVAAAAASSVFADPTTAVTAPLWTWASLPGLTLDLGLRADALGVLMMLVVTWVGSLIVLYASEYLQDDPAFPRFLGLLDLFLSMMLVLVLADGLLLLFMGWEGVGLCSYLLIGFWWQEAKNGLAARKAFLVTRIGDLGLALGLYLLANATGTLDLTAISSAPAAVAAPAALLLLLAAVGKSGQVPLHVWLPDAMAGPTPVSAMIHAATMVAAGVYLIARVHPLFVTAGLLPVVTGVGLVTLLVAGIAALGQHDIKRVLAYSTISQLGYLFVALGAGAWETAMFHFFTHAFFKALLFLTAGAVIEAAHHTQDLRKLGGLGPDVPFLRAVFLVGVASLAAIPVITAGFWSKDLILAHAWASDTAGPAVALLGSFGGLLTATYSFRLYALLFHGPRREGLHAHDHSGWRMKLPLAVLATGAVVLGFLEAPGVHAFTGFLSPGHHTPDAVVAAETTVMALSAVAALLGAGFAFWRWGGGDAPWPAPVAAAMESGLGVDGLYARVVQRPVLAVVGSDRMDLLGAPPSALAFLARAGHLVVSGLQSGRVGFYLTMAVLGAVALIAGTVTG